MLDNEGIRHETLCNPLPKLLAYAVSLLYFAGVIPLASAAETRPIQSVTMGGA
jgi:hypothetical protein